MTASSIVTDVLVVVHLIGVAIVVGAFLMQLRVRSGFRFVLMRIGAMILFASGGALVGTHEVWGIDVDFAKIAVKAGVAALVLASLVVGRVLQRRWSQKERSDAALRPIIFVAGLLAIVDVVVAVAWV